jgi:hypothetical protein
VIYYVDAVFSSAAEGHSVILAQAKSRHGNDDITTGQNMRTSYAI